MKKAMIPAIGLVGSLITIYAFMSGHQSFRASMGIAPPEQGGTPNNSPSAPPQEDREVGLPPSPPDIEAPVITIGDQQPPDSASGCFLEQQQVAVVIKANQATADSSRAPSYELSGADGMPANYYVDDPSNADSSWLEVIMIPGRRIRVNYTVCGNAGIRSLTSIEAISHR